jgi:ABC-type glycerol-3-phosphate transport system substrate-binding protein
MTGIQHVSRRDVLRLGLAAAAATAGIPLLSACGSGSGGSAGGAAPAAGGPSATAGGGGQLVIGAFEDGALTPFKQTILPMFEQATGIKVQFLTEPYDSFFAKAFQDGQSKAGQYDIYIMDDPWIPQYAAAGILEDLGAHGITADSDYAPAFAELGYWPPQKGPRVKGFENDQPALIALPTIGDPCRPSPIATTSSPRRPPRGTTSCPPPRRASPRTRSNTASCSAA